MRIATYRITNEKQEPLVLTIKETPEEVKQTGRIKLQRENGEIIVFYDSEEDVILPVKDDLYLVIPNHMKKMLKPEEIEKIL